jgi:hypothetical protein
MKLSHQSLIALSGSLWLAIGAFLLPLGIHFIADVTINPQLLREQSYPLLSFVSQYTGGLEGAAILLIAASLMIGSLKAKKVFSKVVKKVVTRITSFPSPTKITNIYDYKYLILIGFMMSLGMALRYFGVPKDIRGVIDVIVGSALINGAIGYFKAMIALRNKACQTDAT